MPATHHIDNEAKIILTIWKGEAIDIDFIEAIKNYQKEIQCNPDYSDYNEIVDFSKVTRIKLTTEGIKGLAQIASRTDQSEINRRLAFIVSSNLAFGLARMYEAYRSFSKHASKEVRIFKKSDEAFEWAKKSKRT